MDREALSQAASRLGLALTDGQVDAFEGFEEALYRANEVMNLTRVPREDCAIRHFLDSLLLSPSLPEGSAVLDVGTGPGFPAWPLACARPDLSVTAMDSSGKMLGFLRSQPLPNLEVLQARAEEAGRREAYDVVTGRAVAPLAIQLELSAAFLKIGGRAIPMRTPPEAEEAKTFPANELGLRLVELLEVPLPGTDVVRLLPVFEKVRATPPTYPRRWAEIRAKPLGRS
jgi:16S rRNA (guanine527-N7)-methyltransferase